MGVCWRWRFDKSLLEIYVYRLSVVFPMLRETLYCIEKLKPFLQTHEQPVVDWMHIYKHLYENQLDSIGFSGCFIISSFHMSLLKTKSNFPVMSLKVLKICLTLMAGKNAKVCCASPRKGRTVPYIWRRMAVMPVLELGSCITVQSSLSRKWVTFFNVFYKCTVQICCDISWRECPVAPALYARENIL